MPTKIQSRLPTLSRVMPWLLIIGALVALVASFVLSLDKLESLKNPNFVPNCNINPVLSCGTVMATPEASVFGFPNSWIGLVIFSAVLAVGVGMLAGAQFARWFWLLFKGGMFIGLLFAYWMLLESMFRINALCPYCLSVDVVTITLNWYLTIYLIDKKYLPIPKRLQPIAAFMRKYHIEILVSWFALLIAFILQHFWYYYGQFL